MDNQKNHGGGSYNNNNQIGNNGNFLIAGAL